MATFLAMAGLNRLGMAHVARVGHRAWTRCCRRWRKARSGWSGGVADDRVAGLLAAIHDGPTGCGWRRSGPISGVLDGSCETPIAGLAVLEGGELWLRGEILRPDGSEAIQDQLRGAASDAGALGEELARRMLGQGAEGVLRVEGIVARR